MAQRLALNGFLPARVDRVVPALGETAHAVLRRRPGEGIATPDLAHSPVGARKQCALCLTPFRRQDVPKRVNPWENSVRRIHRPAGAGEVKRAFLRGRGAHLNRRSPAAVGRNRLLSQGRPGRASTGRCGDRSGSTRPRRRRGRADGTPRRSAPLRLGGLRSAERHHVEGPPSRCRAVPSVPQSVPSYQGLGDRRRGAGAYHPPPRSMSTMGFLVDLDEEHHVRAVEVLFCRPALGSSGDDQGTAGCWLWTPRGVH